MSSRPKARLSTPAPEWPVWKATWVVSTASAAIARMPSSAGMNPRAWAGVAGPGRAPAPRPVVVVIADQYHRRRGGGASRPYGSLLL